jgi:16S rRNA (adenine1518-N6/adenine1519-N6)-dimethyltransferase
MEQTAKSKTGTRAGQIPQPSGNREPLGKRAMPVKPKLGQNFLTDRDAMQRIVDSLGDISQTTVIEIGPGQAALTSLLSFRAGRLMAVELDRVLAAQLRMRFARMPNVEIMEADVLTVDIATLLGNRPGPLRDLRPTDRLKAQVVGNLPYYITSDILLHLFKFHESLQRMVLMVQLEVAERIAAEPGGKEYGLLSATSQMYTDVELLFKLPPTAFNPPPKVHSAVLRMTVNPKFEAYEVDELGFIEFLKLVFAQKRKTLSNNLKEKYPPAAIVAALKSAKLKPDVRAEAVKLDSMAKLYNALRT